MRHSVRSFVASVSLVLGVAALAPMAPAGADPVVVYPGMEILQGPNVCTLGYVDPGLRVAFTAGHCRGQGPVTDAGGRTIGNLAVYRDNTPNGATVRTDQLIADYGAIVLNSDVGVNNILPNGRPLDTDPGRVAQPGQPICHFGIITGESCGTVEGVNNGWFTMTNGVVSQKGDSGGPVYVIEGDRAVMLGLFNSTWGSFPAAVSWQSTGDQVREDLGVSNTIDTAAGVVASAWQG